MTKRLTSNYKFRTPKYDTMGNITALVNENLQHLYGPAYRTEITKVLFEQVSARLSNTDDVIEFNALLSLLLDEIFLDSETVVKIKLALAMLHYKWGTFSQIIYDINIGYMTPDHIASHIETCGLNMPESETLARIILANVDYIPQRLRSVLVTAGYLN